MSSDASFRLIANRDMPDLGLLAGDVVIVDPKQERPFALHGYLDAKIAQIASAVIAGALCPASGTNEGILQRLMQLEIARAVALHGPRPSQTPVMPGPIDIDAALKELERPTARPPAEAYGPHLLRNLHGEEAWDRFWQRRQQYERRRPRACKTCGETFVAGTTASAANCRACKAAKRKRCCQCGEVFTVESYKEKRCEPCLDKAATAGEVAAADILRRKRGAQ